MTYLNLVANQLTATLHAYYQHIHNLLTSNWGRLKVAQNEMWRRSLETIETEITRLAGHVEDKEPLVLSSTKCYLINQLICYMKREKIQRKAAVT